MSPPEKIKVGIIGFGKTGILHASSVNMNPEAQWEAVCDSDERMRGFIKIFYPNIPVFSDANEMFQKVSLNTIFICTPSNTHLSLATRPVKENMNLFVENPLAESLASSKQMVELTSGKTNIFSVGYYSPFKVLFQKAKALLESGILDTAKRYRASLQYTLPQDFPSRERVITNRISDFLFLVYWLFGPVKSLYAKAADRFAAAKSGASLVLDHSSDLMGIVDLSWNRPGFPRPAVKISLEGTGGTLDISEDNLRLYLYKKRGDFHKGWTSIHRADLPSPSKFHLCEEGYYEGNRSFLESCASQKKPSIGWKDGLEIIKTIDAANLSIDTNREVSMQEVK
jgi:myo-inositol 2-dehydrogenase/D-chiro-inositol 1-dehydrogenase